MNPCRKLATLLAIGLASISHMAAAAGPDVRDTRVWRQPDYTLYSHNAGMSQTLARTLPRVERALSGLLPLEARYTGLPLHVFLMRESVWDDYLRTGARLHGEFIAGRFENYLLIQSDKVDVPARNSLAHQYSHYFLRTRLGDVLPLWFEDGVATLMQTAEITEKFTLFHEAKIPPGHRVIPMSSLLRIDRESSEYAVEDPARFFAQAMTLTHRILFDEEAFKKQMFAYLPDVQAGIPIDEAVKKNFGMDTEQLGQSMLAYSSSGGTRKGTVKYAEPPEVQLGDGEAMAEVEATQFVARIMFESGAPPDRIAEVLAAAEKLDPGNPGVRFLKLRLAAHREDAAGFEAAWRQVESLTSEAAGARAAGLAIFERVLLLSAGETRQEIAARAFELLSRSEHSLPVDLEAAWALGILSAHLKRDIPFALARVAQAAVIAPNNRDLLMAKRALEKRA
jgi:hypothetical protein